MSGIPYNELLPIEITAKDDSGETVVLGTLYFSIVIPCRDCRNYYESTIDDEGEGEPSFCVHWGEEWIRDDGFCAWAERRA